MMYKVHRIHNIEYFFITGLSPASIYRVNVRAKSRKSSRDESIANLSTEIEFKTLPGGKNMQLSQTNKWNTDMVNRLEKQGQFLVK